MKIQRKELFIEHNYINGNWVASSQTFKVTNPYDGKHIANVSCASASDVDNAIQAAKNAFDIWSKHDAKFRANILEQWYELIMANLDDLSDILTLEQGKPLEDARKEIIYGANFVKWFAEESKKIQGVIPHTSSHKQKILIEYEPVGVVAAITPWNFPSAMITRKIAPALAAGCTAVLKPSELTPLSAFALAKLGEEAGIPKGVLNIVAGDAKAIGLQLCNSKVVRKLSFTGSTNVGKLLYAQSAGTLKKLSLELGGNAPFIVFDDADLEEAAQGLLNSKIRSSGQACTAANRIFLHKPIKAEFLKLFAEKFAKLKVGGGFDPETAIGPLINTDAVTKINHLIKDALNKGAKLLLGGKEQEGTLLFPPTIIDDCTSDMEIFREEIFGPIVAVYEFEDEQALTDMVNDTDYVYTNDHKRVWRIAGKLDYSIIGINESLISNEFGAFGGRKESGFGVEGSSLGIYEYLQSKYLYVK
ncbi:MAG: gabD [Rickettsiaceae bacterium]|nr:gabD [Rickettsiaceae bacterium]